MWAYGWLLLALILALPMLPGAAQEGAVGRIVYTRMEGDRFLLHVMNADSTGSTALPGQTASANLAPSPSPDGKHIAFASGDLESLPFNISVASVDGTRHEVLPLQETQLESPTWSRDGKHLAYTGGAKQSDLYVAAADGNGARKVNPEGSGAFAPVWLADHQSLVYSRYLRASDRADLVLQKPNGQVESLIDGGERRMVLAGAHALSPDGKLVLCGVEDLVGETVTLKVYELESKTETTLFEYSVRGASLLTRHPMPAWERGGKSFLISMPTDKGVGIFRVTADGQTKTRLTPEGSDCIQPAWLPSR